MNITKTLKVLLACSSVLSVVLYSCILFQTFGLLEFQSALFLLYFAEAFLLLTVVFAVGMVLNNKTVIDEVKTKRICVATAVAVLLSCSLLCGYAYLDCYNCYTPEKLFKNDIKVIQPFYPYHNVEEYSREEKDPMDLSVSHIPGTDYIYLYCYGDYFSDTNYDYELEYVKTVSPFMKYKFCLERLFPTQFNETEIDVQAHGEKMKVDGLSLVAYVDGNDYAILLNRFGSCLYASLVNAPESITVEDFAREIINQSELLDNAINEKTFFDVSVSETWSMISK